MAMGCPWPEFSDKINTFIHTGPGKLFVSFRRQMFSLELERVKLHCDVHSLQ